MTLRKWLGITYTNRRKSITGYSDCEKLSLLLHGLFSGILMLVSFTATSGYLLISVIP